MILPGSGRSSRLLTARADALFELTDAVLCADGPVTSLVELSLVAEHRRGHGALYDAAQPAAGSTSPGCAGRWPALPLPRAADGRIVLAVDVSHWLRPDAADQRGAAVLPRLRPGQGPGPDDPGLAVLVRRRAGDRAAPPGPRCWTRSGSARPTTPPRSPPRSSATWSTG